MFFNSIECKQYLNDKGLFLLSKRGNKRIAIKRSKGKDFEVIYEEKETGFLLSKLKSVIFEVDPQEFITIIRPKIYEDYKTREEEIKFHKDIISDMNKSSREFLNKKNALILKDYADKYVVFDLNNHSSDIISDGLFNKEDVFKYTSHQVNKAVKDNMINQYQQDYDNLKSAWKKVKVKKSD